MTTVTVGSKLYAAFLRFILILKNSDPEFIEIMTGVLGMAWGAQLLNPAATTFDGSIAWNAVEHLAPEEVWGMIYATGGAFQVIAVLALAPRWRWLASWGCAASWGLVAGMIWAANPFSTGVVTYGIIAISQVWACWRIALEAP